MKQSEPYAHFVSSMMKFWVYNCRFLVTLLVSAVAAVPSSSIVVVIMVSEAVGIPIAERVGLLMTVEWLV